MHEEIDIRDADGVERDLRQARRPDRADRAHRRPALARLGRARSRRPTSASTPTARSTCSRRRASTRSTPRSSSARPTRSTATRRTGCRSRSTRSGSSCPRDHEYYDGIPTSMSIDGSTHSLFGVSKAAADLLVQEYGRYFDMPTVALPRRLPDRPQPRRHAAARLPLLPDALHDHRPAVHRVRLRGQAGARQHPLRRPGGRLRGVPRRPRAPPPSTTSAAGAACNCSMLEAIRMCEEIAGRKLDWTYSEENRDRRPPLVDLRPLAPFERDHPDWSLRYSVEDILRQIHDANVEHWATGVNLSVVIPAHNEAEVVEPTLRGLIDAPRAGGDRLRDRRRRRRVERRHRRRRAPGRRRSEPRVRVRAQRGAQRLRLRRPQGARVASAATRW